MCKADACVSPSDIRSIVALLGRGWEISFNILFITIALPNHVLLYLASVLASAPAFSNKACSLHNVPDSMIMSLLTHLPTEYLMLQ